MEIKDLVAKQGNVELTATVSEVGEARTFNKFGKEGRVANATLTDGTGTIKLTLWNEQVDQVKPGDKIKIEKGYVNEWQGDLQLTTGKFGTLTVVESGAAPESSESTDVPTEEEQL